MNAHPEVSDQLELLVSRLAALEQRVTALEQPQPVTRESDSGADFGHEGAAARPASDLVGTQQFTSAFSVVGIALLGIAGAYVLRAVYAASLLPRGIIAGFACIFAAAWLVASVRAQSHRFAAALYATASILILAPMLWEIEIRFQEMPPFVAAALLVAYATLAAAFGVLRAGSTAFAVAWCGSALTAVALSVGTHHLALFATILLFMHGVCELTPVCSRMPVMGFVVAVCADTSAWFLVRVYPLSASEQSVYPPLGSAAIISLLALLFAIQLISLAAGTVRGAKPLALVRLVQAMIAFGLLVFGISGHFPATGARITGLLCLALAIAGYAATCRLHRAHAHTRNVRIFLLWSFGLLLGAAALLVSRAAASILLAAIASAAIPIARRKQIKGIEAQGLALLCLAAFGSGLFFYIAHSLAGELPGAPSWPVVLVAASAVGVYAFGSERPSEPVLSQILHLIPPFLAAFAVASLLANAMVALISFTLAPAPFHVAVLRTLSLCVVALAFAFVGMRLGRLQTIRAAYAVLAFATVKLLFEDLRHGRMEFIALSILLVAFGFIGVPRLTRAGRLR